MLFRLGRIYDSHDDALSLLAWLQEIKRNPQLFATIPDQVQLDEDLALVGKRDPLIKKLICLRGNFIAHINWEHTAGRIEIKRDHYMLTWEEIDLLIARASEVLNRYSVLFNRSIWSMQIVGSDDYKAILKAVRSDLKRWDAKNAHEIRRATGTPRKVASKKRKER